MLPDPLFLNVHMYGIMISVGILFCVGVIYLYGKILKFKLSACDFIFYTTVGAIFTGFGSAALFQAFYDFLENPSAGFHFNGGITFLGGLIGGAAFFLVVYYIFRRKNKVHLNLVQLFTIAPCCITIAHAFGRVGCFFAGCCYGKETDCILGVKFPKLPNPVFPTQLYEAIFLFILFGVLSYLTLKKHFRHNMSVYLIAYGVFRFAVEFLRGDDRGSFILGLSPSQTWSLVLIAIGIGLIFIMKKVMVGLGIYDNKMALATAEDEFSEDDNKEEENKKKRKKKNDDYENDDE